MQTEIWPRGYNTFFMLNSTERKIFPAHMSRKITFKAYLRLKRAEFLDIFYTCDYLEFHARLSCA